MISRPLVKYVLTAALRDKLMVTLLLMIILGGSVSVFLGAASLTEADSFSLVFGSGGLRFLGVVGIVLFCCFYIRRAFDNKEVEFLLSRPISRMSFLFSHAAAFVFLSLAVALVVICAVSFLGKPSPEGILVWGESLVVEYAIMAVGALFFSMVLSSAAGSALACLGLYVLARMIGTVLSVTELPAENIIFAILGHLMEVISIIVPRLDLMGQTTWLVYGVEGSAGIEFSERAGNYAHWMMDHVGIIGFIGLQGAVFVALLLAASAFDFMRREF